MPALKQKQPFTTDYIDQLPEGARAELIDGVVYNLATPSRIHQKIVSLLTRIIGNHIADRKLPCDVYPAPFSVRLNENNTNHLEPDLSVICDKDKLTENGCEGAPDWIIEIVSPSSQRKDYFIKLNWYSWAGVRLYWIVDPQMQIVTVHDFEHETMKQYRFTDSVPVAICGDFSIRLADYDL